MPVEEWFFTEDLETDEVNPDTGLTRISTHHRSEHASETPHVQAIIVFLEVHEKLRSFEVAGGYPDVVFCLRVVELG